MNRKTLIIGTILALLLLTACSQRAADTSQQQTSQQQQTTTDASIDEVEQTLNEVDKLAQDLETGELENVDADLEDIEQADI
ncbi:hypothetical protein HY484_03410 [Candidatus Woesearchaeota archaeon]|nr:hypothetical protein [Candidatus Woesearchaeota archaeon]